jgi:Zn-dependent protease
MDPRFEVLPPGPPSAKPKPNGLFAAIGGFVVLLLKAKYLLFGALKTSLSMLLMIWVYSMMYGWPFAIGFVVLLLVHEMGHVVAAKLLGMPITAPIFIPFVGAYITMKQNPRDAWSEALMAYGGPLAGCVGGWICLGAALHAHQAWLLAVASATFVINLFNMIPMPPLDGGRICSAVSTWFWFIGIALLAAAVIYFHAISAIVIIIFIMIMAFPRLKQTLFQKPTEEMRRYYSIHPFKRVSMAVLYLGLIAVLLIGYWDAGQELAALRASMETAAPVSGT